MTNIAFLYGTLSGLVVIGGILGTIVLGGDHGTGSLLLGYLIMLVALSMIFFGVKRYRDTELGGVIKFVPAFLTGLAIAAVAGVIYVIVWEVYLAATHYSFMEAYPKAIIAAERAKGTTGPALDAIVKQMEDFKTQYANPLFRLPMTFMEIFPVGFVIALISAALLRNPRVLPARA
jgi:hypothetical protein